MFINPGFGILTSLLSWIATCLGLLCLDGLPLPSQAELAALEEQQARLWQAEAQRTVLGIVPNEMRACGFVALRADPSAALKCVEHAERHRLPYWVASEAQGIDSHVWVVVLKDADGASQFSLDSYGWESTALGQPRYGVTQMPCEVIKLHPAVQAGSPDGPAVYWPAVYCER